MLSEPLTPPPLPPSERRLQGGLSRTFWISRYYFFLFFVFPRPNPLSTFRHLPLISTFGNRSARSDDASAVKLTIEEIFSKNWSRVFSNLKNSKWRRPEHQTIFLKLLWAFSDLYITLESKKVGLARRTETMLSGVINPIFGTLGRFSQKFRHVRKC